MKKKIQNDGSTTGAVKVHRFNFAWCVAQVLICLLLSVLSGCSLSGGPRARAGHLPTDTIGIAFPNTDNLDGHSYGFSLSEPGGIVYTCRGGHLDLDHIRGNADNTRWLFKKITKTLSKGRDEFSFKLTGEMSSHKIQFIYPDNWDSEKDKERIIEQIAYDTAPYLSHMATVWHEIQTWFGVHFAVLEPEFNSAFSWEDEYSNVLGTIIAVEAMKDTGHDFNEAVDIALNKWLTKLEVQPSSTAKHASDKVRGQWYTGNFIPDMKMRNFDIGLDGSITPTIVKGIEGCESAPLSISAPTLDTLKRYGFSMNYEIKPNVLEQGSMFKAAGSKKIIPEVHFPILLDYMKNEAKKRGDMIDE